MQTNTFNLAHDSIFDSYEMNEFDRIAEEHADAACRLDDEYGPELTN